MMFDTQFDHSAVLTDLDVDADEAARFEWTPAHCIQPADPTPALPKPTLVPADPFEGFGSFS